MESIKHTLRNHYLGQELIAENWNKDNDAMEALINDYSFCLQKANGFGLIQSKEIPFDLRVVGEKIKLRSILALNSRGKLFVYDKSFPEISSVIKKELSTNPINVFLKSCERRTWNKPNEDSLNKKFRIPNYHLVLKNINEDIETNSLLHIGRIQFENDKYYLSKEFIPTVVQIGGYDNLQDKVDSWKLEWDNWLTAIGKIICQTQNLPYDSSLNEINMLSKQMGYHLAKGQVSLKNATYPSKVIMLFCELASIMLFNINRAFTHKREVLEIFGTYTSGTSDFEFCSKKFEQSLTNLSTHIYDHSDITRSVSAVDHFINDVGQTIKLLGNRTFGHEVFHKPNHL